MTVEELLEARTLLEVPAARLAAERRANDDVTRLRQCIHDSGPTVDAAVELAHNTDFHAIVLATSGNTLLAIAAQPVFNVLMSGFSRSSLGTRFHQSVRRQHREIADAIDKGDPVAAGDLMHDHLEYLRPHYEKLWEQAKRERERDRAARGRPRARARAVRRRALGHAAARRPRRRGDQDRGPGVAGRRRPLRAAVPGGRGLALLRDVQPEQEERLARPPRTRARRAVFEDLVRDVDVVFSNLRGDQPAKLRITYDDLKDVNPRIVCCSLSGFGMTGPRASDGGYDYMMQALAGWMTITGEPGGPPTKSGLSLVDLSGGYVAAIAMLGGALARAARRGRLRLRRLPLRHGARRALLRRDVGGDRGVRARAAPQLGAPVDRPVPELRDGGRLDRRLVPEAEVLAAPVRRDRAARAAGRPALRRLRRARRRTPSELLGILEPLFRERPTAEWLERLAACGRAEHARQRRRRRPRGPADRRARERRRDRPPRLGTVRQVATPLRLERRRGAAPPRRRSAASTPARCSESCAATRAEQLDELAEAGVFGDPPVGADAAVRRDGRAELSPDARSA